MMWHVFVLMICVRAERQLPRPRVYHAQEDVNKEFPYVVSMEHRDGSRVCTCNLIAENWLITAGHSVKRRNVKNRRVRYADFTLNETQAYSDLVKVIRHPSYFFTTATDVSAINDLALVLIQKVPIRTFVKLSAIDYRGLVGFPVKLAGFGITVEEKISKAKMPGDDLRAIQVGEAVVTPCPHTYPMFGPAICVAPKCSNKLLDTRKGDAGGPLVYRGKLVGVIIGSEFGYSNAYAAPVSPNLNWISDVMKKFS